MKRVAMAIAAVFLSSAAFADPPPAGTEMAARVERLEQRLDGPIDATLPPVESLSCQQMQAELMVAGRLMNQQLDPSFAANVQEMRDQMDQRPGMASGIATGAVCALPGAGLVCAGVMQAQIAQQRAQAAQHQQQMNQIAGQVEAATQGLDLQRMQALGERWESQRCQGDPALADPSAH